MHRALQQGLLVQLVEAWGSDDPGQLGHLTCVVRWQPIGALDRLDGRKNAKVPSKDLEANTDS